MRAELAINLLLTLAIFAGVLAWSIRLYTRVNRHVASLLEAPRMSWDAWGCASLLDGIWKDIPVRIRSSYLKPTLLSVTIRVSTRPPDLDACVNSSGMIEFRSIRNDGIGMRILARVVEDELSRPGPPVRAAIPAYFTPARMEHLRVLLRELGWERFRRSEEGIGVSRSGTAPARWKTEQACHEVLRTLVELQKMGV